MMQMNMNDPNFRNYLISSASQEELVKKLTNGNIRGLDRLALRTISQRRQLPNEVVNVLLAYFFGTFANTVYDRKLLGKIYDFWANQGVHTFAHALTMAKLDITDVLQGNNESI
ncbi:hypothetical protein [Peribacillus sp. SCS-155]|uniref:hypothetical protein n=1 Tax=Peribacillus sedimenti TaxID=3115297 RepID=UPI0039061FAB